MYGFVYHSAIICDKKAIWVLSVSSFKLTPDQLIISVVRVAGMGSVYVNQ